MKNSLLKENFYKNLTPSVQDKFKSLLKAAKIKNASEKISLFIYCTISIIFIYYFKKTFYTVRYFSNLDNVFKFAKFLVIINGSILISTYITKIPKDNYSKAITSFKNVYLLSICNCKLKCNCKTELSAYLKKQGINL
ncbi:hypothetical protein NNC19_15135 [Clostridium sp. SHJSY1]|uniref:hypothetical protein n=1 Tax=Clostridium sp. SHJSY1 TaxID=2942483 RepID=UPI0028757580|nr:hypothetical protein [Clostridium sp. SHJSY1]MDS0527026.1 hypothetical protein [Clostridium sp. SHJSY1]